MRTRAWALIATAALVVGATTTATAAPARRSPAMSSVIDTNPDHGVTKARFFFTVTRPPLDGHHPPPQARA
ncbi:MAG TPA: hypothetical protein VH914_19775 [Acidimicrobiia bacterium]|nr:hypothetical protein [Acidimicrobiia bacterium]